MPIPVLLKDVVEAMEPLSDEWQVYINRNTGEIAAFSDEEARLAEEDDPDAPAWQKELLPRIREVLGSDEFVALPSKFDFHEYMVMERFCLQQDESEFQRELLGAIRGRGAFRRFKELIHAEGIEEQWYEYRTLALRTLAVHFLEAEGIPFVEQ